MSPVGEEVAVTLEPLCLGEKELVLLAVNDSFSVTSAGGSHWCVGLVLVAIWVLFHSRWLMAVGGVSVGMAHWCMQLMTVNGRWSCDYHVTHTCCRSLLAYIRSEDTFKHFDSLQGSNLPSAEQCATKLAPLVNCV